MISSPAAGPESSGPGSVWLGLVGAILGTLLVHPLRSARPLGEDEAHWLLAGRGLARGATDLWLGLLSNDALARLPVLVMLLGALLGAAMLCGRRAGPLVALVVPIGSGTLLAPWLGGLPVASSAPWGVLTATLVLAVLAAGRPQVSRLLLPMASVAAIALEPGAAVIPLGAAVGAWLGSRSGSRRWDLRHEPDDAPRTQPGPPAGREIDPGTRRARPRAAGPGHEGSSSRTILARAMAIAGWLTVVALLVLHPPVLSPHGTQSKTVLTLQTLAIAAALAAASLSVVRPRGLPARKSARPSTPNRLETEILDQAAARDSRDLDSAPSMAARASRDRGPDAVGGAIDPGRDRVLAFASLGSLAVGVVWLLVPGLRAVSLAPAPGLLYLAPSLAVLAGGAARRVVSPGPGSVEAASQRAPRSAPRPLLPILGLSVIALSVWVLARPRPSRPLPLAPALAAMKMCSPELRQILPGPGLTPGLLRHAARSSGLAVVTRPEQPLVGAIGLAAVTPSLSERNEMAARLGDRVLDSYGIVSGDDDGPAVRWSTFRPLTLRVLRNGSRPNIAIVTVDTLRADHLSVYGYPRQTSPRLLQWSRRALVFDRAMAAAPSTAPSFASLLTGRLPLGHGVRKNYEFLDPGNWTLARLLKRAGYETAAFVSSFVLTAENSGLDLGFDVYDQTFELSERNRKDRPLRLAPALTAALVPWLRNRRPSDAPWFLWVHTIDPHGPYTPLPEYARAFEGGPRRVLPRGVIPDYQWLESVELSDYVNAYDDEILQTDTSLGTILEEIGALDGPRGTLVIFVADHGEAFGEHGLYFQHGQSLHTEEIHVPLIVEDTRAPRTGRVGTPVSAVDIVPTILASLGVDTDLFLDGETLGDRESSAARESALDPAHETNYVASTWKPGEVMVCRSPWKLMIRGGRTDAAPSYLYNILEDPRETHPLPAASAESGLIQAARSLLARDPLTPRSDSALDAQQWEALDPDAKQKLKSLGYGGP